MARSDYRGRAGHGGTGPLDRAWAGSYPRARVDPSAWRDYSDRVD